MFRGDAIPSVLWLIVMYKIIRILVRSGVKDVVYANHLVILVSGVFPSVISEIKEGLLKNVCLRANRGGLGINSTKTDVILHPPRLNEQRLGLSSNENICV